MKNILLLFIISGLFACSDGNKVKNNPSHQEELVLKTKEEPKNKSRESTGTIAGNVCGKITVKNLKELFDNKRFRITKSSSRKVKKTQRCTYQCATGGKRFTVYYREVETARPGSSIKYYTNTGYRDGKRKIVPKIVNATIDNKKVAWSEKEQFLAWGKENVRILYFKNNEKKLKLEDVISFAQNIE